MEPNLHAAIEEQSRILRDISDRLVAQDARWRTLETTVTQNSASIQALEVTLANTSSSVPRSDLEIQMAATATRLDAVEAAAATRVGALESATAAFESWRPFVEAAVDDIKYSVEKLRGDFAKSSAPPHRLPLPSPHHAAGVLGPTLRPRSDHRQPPVRLTALMGTTWIITVGSLVLGMYLLKPTSRPMVRPTVVFLFHIQTWIHGMITLIM